MVLITNSAFLNVLTLYLLLFNIFNWTLCKDERHLYDSKTELSSKKAPNVFSNLAKFSKKVKKFLGKKAKSENIVNSDPSLDELKYKDGKLVHLPNNTGNMVHLNSTIIEIFKENPFAKDIKHLFNDAYFPKQLYLFPKKDNVSKHFVDMGIMHVWLLLRNFGLNIRIMVLGQGLSKTNKDLKLDMLHSLDLTPKDKFKIEDQDTNINAGIIGMQEDDGLCGVGIVPKAILSEVKYSRFLTNMPLDLLVMAIKHSRSNADVALITWKLNYNHYAFERSDSTILINNEFQHAAKEGRNGKGVVYVLATGTLSYLGQSCTQNPLINFIYTIPVMTSKFNGDIHPIMETCSAIMVTAYGVAHSSDYMVSTGIGNACNIVQDGNPVGAAMVASIVALTLRARPSLTWRDIQYIIALTSQVHSLAHNQGVWKRNGAGFFVSEVFGFGLINAYQMVILSTHNKYFPVPPMKTCIIDVLEMYKSINSVTENVSIPFVMEFSLKCKHSGSDIRFIEHVQIQFTLRNSINKDLSINLVSPERTESVLLRDDQFQKELKKDMVSWFLDSIIFWGETAVGTWKISILSKTRSVGVLLEKLEVYIHGVEMKPSLYEVELEKRKLSSYLEPHPKI